MLFRYSSPPVDHSVINPFAGMGGLIMPLGVWIHPAYLPLYWETDWVDPRVVSYLSMIVLIAPATYCLGRSFDLTPPLAAVAAQIVAVVFFPPVLTVYARSLSLAHMNAHAASVAYPTILQTCFLVTFIRTGVGSARTTIMATFALPLIVLYSVLCDPLFTTVIFVPGAFFVLGVLLSSSSIKVFVSRAVSLLFCLAVLLVCKVDTFYRAVSGYSARLAFPTEIADPRPDYGSAFAFQSVAAAIVVVLSLIIYALVFLLGTRQVRGFIASVIVFVVVVTLMSAPYRSDAPWDYPAPSYFEHGALPAFIVGLLLGVQMIYRRLHDRLNARVKESLSYAGVLAIPVLGFGMASQWRIPELKTDEPPPSVDYSASMIQQLTDLLSMDAGDPFRGSFASVIGVPGGDLARFLLYEDDAPFEEMHNVLTGRFMVDMFPELLDASLWHKRIPMLEEYNHLNTPPMYYVFSRALARPQDTQSKNVLHVTHVNPKFLSSMGVKFVVSDMELESPELNLRFHESKKMDSAYAYTLLAARRLEDPALVASRMNDEKALRITLRLYEVDQPNLGDYAPRHVRRYTNAPKALQFMLSDQFDFRNDVVVSESLGDIELDHVDAASMFFECGGVRVRAESRGRSLLVLPLQFSNSLKIVSSDNPAAPQPRILRVNLIQTGILFQGKINLKIAHDFGIFGDVESRLRDIDDCRRLGIAETSGTN